MSDYIPTTDQIRAEFVEAYENNALPLEFRYSTLVDMFDRWLKQHDAEVAKATEERIIKLLTSNSIERLGFYGEKILLSPLEAHRGYDSDIDDEHFIALIKGENNG